MNICKCNKLKYNSLQVSLLKQYRRSVCITATRLQLIVYKQSALLLQPEELTTERFPDTMLFSMYNPRYNLSFLFSRLVSVI